MTENPELREQWLNEFRGANGREPLPEEFLAAKQQGFSGAMRPTPEQPTPEQPVVEPPQLSAEDARTAWLESFQNEYGRAPSPAEFSEARAAGFSGAGTENGKARDIPAAENPAATTSTPVVPSIVAQPAVAAPVASLVSPVARGVAATTHGGGKHRTGVIVAVILVLALVVAGIVFGIPGTGFGGLVNKQGEQPDVAASSSPSGSSSRSGSASVSPSSASASSADAAATVRTIQDVLNKAAGDRSSLAGQISSCNVAGLQTITDNRAAEIKALAEVDASKIPNGAQLTSDLSTALSYSQSADQQYLSWAQAGCRGTYPDFPSNAQATQMKQDFAQVWNSSIVGTYPEASQVDPNNF